MWAKYKLSELGAIVGGATPSTSVEKYYGGEIAWVTPKDLSSFSGRYIECGERNITEEGLNSCSAQLLPAGSVLFSSRAPIGYVAIAKNPIATNQGFKSLVPDTKKVDSLFMYYLLKYNKNRIEAMGSGTTFKEVSGATMKNIEVNLPPLAEQKRISGILGALDDKIELNRRINANLEEQAQALFKSWFMDFEPFRDNPFVDSELGKIPQGWKVTELGNVTKQQTEKVGQQTTVKVLSPVTTGELVLSEEYFTKQVFSESIAKYIIVKPNQFAYNPARINIGSIGRNTFGFDGCVSPVYVVFECEKGYHYFFDFFRKTDAFKKAVISRAIGGVRQTLGYKDFALIKVVYPPENVVRKFNAIYINLLNSQNHHNLENKTLSALRDTLLPKLMSSELSVESNYEL